MGSLTGQKQSTRRLKKKRRTIDTEMKATRRKLDKTTRTARLSAGRLRQLSQQVAERQQMIDGLNRDLTAIDSRIAAAIGGKPQRAQTALRHHRVRPARALLAAE